MKPIEYRHMAEWTALLVDDEEDFLATLAERLELRGIEVLKACDGGEALAMVERHRPDVVLLDVVMPGLDGLETLRAIKASHPEIEVVLLTGRGGTREGIEGMRRGAFDFLTKPVRIDELVEILRAATRHSFEPGG